MTLSILILIIEISSILYDMNRICVVFVHNIPVESATGSFLQVTNLHFLDGFTCLAFFRILFFVSNLFMVTFIGPGLLFP